MFNEILGLQMNGCKMFCQIRFLCKFGFIVIGRPAGKFCINFSFSEAVNVDSIFDSVPR